MRDFFIVLFLCSAALGARPVPATQPDDALTAQAKQLLAGGRLADIAAAVEPRLRTLLADPAAANADEVLRLCTLREFSRYFARVPNATDGQRDALRFLLSSPRLLPLLMMNICEGDPPDHLLEVLRSLRADHRMQLDDNAELAAAMCIVWDAPERYGADEEAQVSPELVCGAFGRFLRSQRLRGDEDHVELMVFVVDVELTEQELDWAADRFGDRPDVPRVLMSVPYVEGDWYDRRALYERAQSEADEHAFVLPNIARRGGNCGDAAYFAAQIARTAGIPAAIVRAAEAGDGATPAWVAFASNSQPPTWDMHSARHPSHVDWPGEVTDPQTYEPIDDSELALIAAAAQTPASQRMASAALCKASDLTPAEKLIALYARAFEVWPSNRRAWHLLAVLEAEGKLKEVDMQRSAELMEKHLLTEFPEFLLLLRLRTLQKSGTLQHAAGMTRLRQQFRDRAALLARIELAAGDRMREDKRRPEAVNAYLEALRLANESPATALRALSRLDDLLRHMDGLERLGKIYAEVFPNLTPPRQSRLGQTTPYYRIGARYAAVLDEQKQAQPAAAVRAKIAQVVLLP